MKIKTFEQYTKANKRFCFGRTRVLLEHYIPTIEQISDLEPDKISDLFQKALQRGDSEECKKMRTLYQEYVKGIIDDCEGRIFACWDYQLPGSFKGIELCGLDGDEVLYRHITLYEDGVQVEKMEKINRDKLEGMLYRGTIKCDADWPTDIRRCFKREVEDYYEACDYIDMAAESEDGYYEFKPQ